MSSQPTRAGFVELPAAWPLASNVSSASSPASGIEILIGERRVRVPPGFNREVLGAVIRVLEDLA